MIMKENSARTRLMELIAHRDPPTDLKRASLACGKNHAYLHQFVHRGTPRKLPEDVRYALAVHLGVDESVLRDDEFKPAPLDPHPNPPLGAPRFRGMAEADEDDERLIAVPELRTSNVAAASDPSIARPDAPVWGFPRAWIAHVLKARAASLRVVQVDGAAMEPEFRSGDRLLVDIDRRAPSPPGAFVLFDGMGLVPRHLELVPNSEPSRVVIRTHETLVPNREAALSDTHVVGRVVWHARCL